MLVSPAEHDPLLRTLGQTSSVCERLGVDFLFHGKRGLAGAQRKRVDDLVASIRGDDRLARELVQMEQLHQAVLIVEGSFGWTRGCAPKLHYSWKEYQGLKLSMQIAHGVAVMETADTAETAELLLQLQDWFAHADHDSLLRRRRDRRFPAEVHLLGYFPGVSVKKAKAIYGHFGRVPLAFDCTFEEMCAVPTMGKVSARKLFDALPGGVNGTHGS